MSTKREDRDISQTDIRLGLALLQRKQTNVTIICDVITIKIDISHLTMGEDS